MLDLLANDEIYNQHASEGPCMSIENNRNPMIQIGALAEVRLPEISCYSFV